MTASSSQKTTTNGGIRAEAVVDSVRAASNPREVTRVWKVVKDKRGQSLVEFALVLPVIIFLLMAIMEGGRIFSAYVELQSVARDGARYASIHCTVANVPESQVATWVSDTLAPFINGRLAALDDSRLTVEFDRNTDGISEVWVELTLRSHSTWLPRSSAI